PRAPPSSCCRHSLVVPLRGWVWSLGAADCARVTREFQPLDPQSPVPLSVPEVIAQRRGAVARALLVALPIGAELVRLHRANRESDLPLLGRQLDDLHRIGF